MTPDTPHDCARARTCDVAVRSLRSPGAEGRLCFFAMLAADADYQTFSDDDGKTVLDVVALAIFEHPTVKRVLYADDDGQVTCRAVAESARPSWRVLIGLSSIGSRESPALRTTSSNSTPRVASSPIGCSTMSKRRETS